MGDRYENISLPLYRVTNISTQKILIDMKAFLKTSLVVISLLLITGVNYHSSAAKRITVGELKCENLISPIAIDNTSPHFSWKMFSDENAASITAYQIIVASEPGKLNEKSADLWNSGKINSSESIGIKYGGKPLDSRSSGYWKVRVWDQSGKVTKWSETAYFGVGMLRDSDWAAGTQFIGIHQSELASKKHIAPIVRTKFNYSPSKERVLLHVNSLGYHEAYINGKPVSTSMLNPAVSEFSKRSLIVTYDITDLVERGDNELAIWLGIGWYHKRAQGAVEGGPYVRAQVECVNQRGNYKVLANTDKSWKAANSGRYFLGNVWVNGEYIDKGSMVTDLSPKALANLDWQPVVVGQIPQHSATPQMCEGNTFYQTFKPVAVHKIDDECYIYDMGHAFVGFIDIEMPVVEKGKAIKMYYEDFYLKDLKKFRDNETYADYYIGDGESQGTFSNKFQYKAFRYLKIKGLDAALDPSAITGRAITTAYSGESSFECSDDDINAIHNMVHKTVKALTLGGYMVDCPHIERLGYGGDGNASTPTFQTMFNVSPLYLNWLTAWSDCQRENGDMPHTAPNPISAGGGPFWCEFIIIASWQSYLNYGDTRMIERFYPQMEKWIGFAESNIKDGVLKNWGVTKYRNWYLGDWATPEGIDQRDERSIDIVSNCVLSESYLTMSKIARVLGKDNDAEAYLRKHKQQNEIIHKTFFDASSKSYASDTQIDMIYPMFVGATPKSEVGAVEKRLWEQTEKRFKGHLATGLVGIPIITQWATREAKAEEMYHMLKKREYPGYLYMLDNGTDLTWEHWDGDRSHIHNCYNGIGSWFYQALGGITPDESQPGYKHINIRPQIIDEIDWVKVSKDTPYGKLFVGWNKTEGQLKIDVEIPIGSSATLYTPDGKSVKLSSGSHSVSCAIASVN